MQMKRPRRTGRQTAPTGTAPQTPVGTGRPTHVRTRLIVAVAVVAAAVAGAGAPSLLTASQDVGDSQDLVTLASRTQDALALANSLADERDEVTSYIASGRDKSKAPDEDRSARVDRQVEDLRAEDDTPASLRGDLDGIAAVRRAALTGKTTALQTQQAYSDTIAELHRLAEQLADQTPPRAGSGAHALAELDTAVQQSAAARGLLLAALNVPSTTRTVINPVTGLPTTTSSSSAADRKQRDQLAAAAQQARLRADAALADFRADAPRSAVESYDSTVTGPEVNSAEKYLATLTDQPTLADSELTTSTKKLDAALSARVDLMRGAESALYDHRTKELAKLRDDDVTALEIRIAVLGALMLVAVGLATAMARTLTRPLSVLRRGTARLAESEDPTAQEPIAFTGRNDEFAQVVRSVNALHGHAVALRERAAALQERVATLETDRKHLVGQRQQMADAREGLRAELAESAARLERMRTSIGGTFVNLALRTLGLVERQLGVIEGLEEREQDPDRLATLFKLDHFATVMRRHSENLLVLAGAEHVQQHHAPVPLVDVVRAGVSEIERYERVRIAALPPHAHVAGFAADDLSHLLAELMENATSFSPPDLPVEISGWLLESGEVMLSVQDEGIGMAADRLDRLNARLADFDPESGYDDDSDDGLGLGLYVVARLAHRHGVRVQLREQKQGGVAAVVVLPAALVTDPPSTALPPHAASPGATGTFSLPGADAEVNSNVLHARPKHQDLLVTLAEEAVRQATTNSPYRAEEPTTISGDSAEGPASAFGEATAGPASAFGDAAAGPEMAFDDRTGGDATAFGDAAAGPEMAFDDRAGGDTTAFGDVSGRPGGAFGDAAEGSAAAFGDRTGGTTASGNQAERPAGPFGEPAGESATASGDAAGGPAGGSRGLSGETGSGRASDESGRAFGRTVAEGEEAFGRSGAEGHGAAVREPAEDAVREAFGNPAAERPAGTFGEPAGESATASGDAAGGPAGGSRGLSGETGSGRASSESEGALGGPADEWAARDGSGTSADQGAGGAFRGPASDAVREAFGGPADEQAAWDGSGSPAGRGAGVGLRGSAGDAVRDVFGGSAGDAAERAVHEQAGVGGRDAETRPKAPVETFAESTMELLLPDLTREPTDPQGDGGGGAPQGAPAVDDDSGSHARAEGEAEAEAEEQERVTAKGLPKRTPKITVPNQAPRQRSRSVDAEALRRRLGGFRQGAQAGYRDVEAEIAERTENVTGGTAEEASS
ncbi:nitrate- and nitrite sensing domain-containing protein [Streptomyces sp. NPDC007206]|uniref:sensor histidine kinase n=1 Tax=Streptomyces sp. NPDC007206 TaxID=3154317 RepID=UPI0033F01C30